MNTSRKQFQPGGIDSPVKSREDDCLNRWPLAQEIYGIATTGPIEWSVRVGIYGAWGTGKTSVLEFIAYLARRHAQCVIRFNPWQYSTKAELWRAFVLSIVNEPTLVEKIAGKNKIVAKDWVSRLFPARSIASAGISIWNDKVGQAVGEGLGLVKKYFSFGPNDLKLLQDKLGDKRIFIIIDDLDRTAPELVPEILFALKELMDIPRFAFVCAFDPDVVGETLAQYHPGFGDGLKFLEKIIDYPRWLPEAQEEGLFRIASQEADRYCDYVPKSALREAISFLPRNPRAVRQFIRLIALLKPQIQRHSESELHWPVILAANVIKIRAPKLADVLLGDNEFWGSIEFLPFSAKDGQKEAELNEAISKHLEKCAAACKVQLEPNERTETLRALRSISSRIVSAWFGSGVDALIYQMSLAESPHAVTWKEFEQFTATWRTSQTSATVTVWIDDHSARVMRSAAQVYHELLRATLIRYDDSLRQISAARTADETPSRVENAKAFFSLLECLVLELGDVDMPDRQITDSDIDKLFETLTHILKSSGPPQLEFCKRNETLLMRMIEKWRDDITVLIEIICPYGHFGSDYFSGSAPHALHQRLTAAVLPKFVSQIVTCFRKTDYILEHIWKNSKISQQIRCLFRMPDGPLWTTKRQELIGVLRDAGTDENIRGNACELLDWFRQHFSGQMPFNQGDAEAVKAILLNKDFLNPVWDAATVKPLAPRTAMQLNQFVTIVKKLGGNVDLPVWWEATIGAFKSTEPPEK